MFRARHIIQFESGRTVRFIQPYFDSGEQNEHRARPTPSNMLVDRLIRNQQMKPFTRRTLRVIIVSV